MVRSPVSTSCTVPTVRRVTFFTLLAVRSTMPVAVPSTPPRRRVAHWSRHRARNAARPACPRALNDGAILGRDLECADRRAHVIKQLQRPDGRSRDIIGLEVVIDPVEPDVLAASLLVGDVERGVGVGIELRKLHGREGGNTAEAPQRRALDTTTSPETTTSRTPPRACGSLKSTVHSDGRGSPRRRSSVPANPQGPPFARCGAP